MKKINLLVGNFDYCRQEVICGFELLGTLCLRVKSAVAVTYLCDLKLGLTLFVVCFRLIYCFFENLVRPVTYITKLRQI